MSDMDKLFEEKLNRISTTASHREPDVVPVVLNAETWVISYAGCNISDVQNDMQKELACFSKAYQDIYCDGSYTNFLTRDVNIYNALGGSAFFYSNDDITIQHKENASMREDEYFKLTKDPMGFTVNEIFPRKYPALNKPYPQNLEALRESLQAFGRYIQKIMASAQNSRKQGVPDLIGSVGQAPVDLIMDYYRGFKGMMLDIKRRPEEVKEAAEALIPIIMVNITHGKPNLEPYPYVFFPLHMPCFLNAKQFESTYWPSFKKILDQVHQLGGKAVVYLEGNWEHLYDFVNEFPQDFAIVMLEKDDIFKAKDKIGNVVAISGGIELNMLKTAAKQECLDHVKKVIDKCAPGGGFIFSTDKCLLAPGDVKVENLTAVHEFVHSYGRY